MSKTDKATIKSVEGSPIKEGSASWPYFCSSLLCPKWALSTTFMLGNGEEHEEQRERQAPAFPLAHTSQSVWSRPEMSVFWRWPFNLTISCILQLLCRLYPLQSPMYEFFKCNFALIISSKQMTFKQSFLSKRNVCTMVISNPFLARKRLVTL